MIKDSRNRSTYSAFQIELSHAVIEFSICADTLEILQDILRDISVGWASKPINQESPSVPASEIIDENGSSSDLQPMLGKQKMAFHGEK